MKRPEKIPKDIVSLILESTGILIDWEVQCFGCFRWPGKSEFGCADYGEWVLEYSSYRIYPSSKNHSCPSVCSQQCCDDLFENGEIDENGEFQ